MTDGVPTAGLRIADHHTHKHAPGAQHVARRDAATGPWPLHEKSTPPTHRASTIFAHEARAALARRFPGAGHAHDHGRLDHAWRARADLPTTPEDTANSLVGTAKRIVASEPKDAQATIAEIGREVRTAAAAARLVVRSDAERTEVDAALRYFETGLSALESNDAEQAQAQSRAEAHLRQGSRIQIRTQEGDVVELRLRRALSASTVTTDTANGSTNQIAVSGKLGLRLDIVGDINESELAAISAVFEQAASIAEAFFAGDLAAAFDAAAGIEFDTDQLATISLAFRFKAYAATTYAALAETAPAQSAEAPAAQSIASEATATAANESAVPSAETPVSETSENDVAAAPSGELSAATTDAAEASATAGAQPAGDSARIDSLADLTRIVADFFASLIAGLEDLQTASDESPATSYRLATAFKLELLQTVLRVAAPDAQGDAAVAAADAIEQGSYATEESAATESA